MRTFKTVALACIKAEAPGWKSGRTALLWETSLERWAFPTLGKLPVAEVDRAAVLGAVGDVWASRPATGRKVLRHAGLPALPGGRKQPSLPWARLSDWQATEPTRAAYLAAGGDPETASTTIPEMTSAAARDHSEWFWRPARARLERHERYLRSIGMWPPPKNANDWPALPTDFA